MNNKLRNFCFSRHSTVNIAQNGGFQFAQRHALNLYRQNAVYSFIPKNGCTTLRASLAVANGFLLESDIENKINWVHNNTYTTSASLKELACADYTFTVLRCPYARLVSLFLDKFVDKTPVAWNFYRHSNNIFDLDKITFFDFVNYLYRTPSAVQADIHWRRQKDFLIYSEYDDYFDFDDFNTIETTLKEKLGLKLIDTRQITKHGRDQHNTLSGQDFSKTPVDALKVLKQQGSIPDMDCMVSAEIKSMIQKIYVDDIALTALSR